jgi:hypothetical protein
MDVTRSTETSDVFQLVTRRYISEDIPLLSHYHEILEFYTSIKSFELLRESITTAYNKRNNSQFFGANAIDQCKTFQAKKSYYDTIKAKISKL